MQKKKNHLVNYEKQYWGIIFVFQLHGLTLPAQQSFGISLINLLTLLKGFMKKFLVSLALAATVMFMFSSCAATKRDCQGVKHYKQKGGFYM